VPGRWGARYSARREYGNRRALPAYPAVAYHAPVNSPALPGYRPSWYASSSPATAPRPHLEADIAADVVVLGAGFTGLGAALSLARQGLDVVVLEAQRVGWGASGRNGGQALAGFGCDQSVLEGLVGMDQARVLFDYSRDGLALLKARIAEHRIDCQWRDGAADVAITPRQDAGLQAHARHMARHYDYPLQYWSASELGQVLDSPRFVAGLYDPAAGHLHPLRYALGLARAAQQHGVRIYEHSPVLGLQRGAQVVMTTPRGRVRAPFAVIAGNALLAGIAPALERRIMPVGTYVGATPPLGPERAHALIANDMAVADVNWALDYFRLTADHRLLFGGMAAYSALPPPGLQAAMTRRMHAVFPQLRDVALEKVWGGMIDITRNRAPHFGRLDPNLYFAQGFCGHGVAATGLAGELIARAIAGQADGLDAFAGITHRPFPGGRLLRRPLLVAAMSWYKLRDRLG
jgi:gamma-glutamylputrescine oxidase